MKAYVTCPVSHTQNRLNLLPEIDKVAKENGIETFIFKVGGTPQEIFKRDEEQLNECDILIAEVSERSHGVGIEIGMSQVLGLKIILLHEKGTFVTALAHGMPGIKIIEYSDLADMKVKLANALNQVKN